MKFLEKRRQRKAILAKLASSGNWQERFFFEEQSFIEKKIISYMTIIDKLDIQDRMKILELGCGFGEVSKVLNSFQYDGFDIDSERIQICKSNQNSNHKFYCEDLINHEFNYSYDIVICISAIDEIDNKLDYLNKIYHLMNENSKLYLEVRNSKYFMNKLPFKLTSFFEFIGLKAQKYSDVEDLNYYEYQDLINLSGFEIVNESCSIQPNFINLNTFRNTFLTTIKSLLINFSNLLAIQHRYTISFTLMKK